MGKPGEPSPSQENGTPDPTDPWERLWGRKQLGFEGGEPTVTVCLMKGQREVRFLSQEPVRLTARGGLEKTVVAPGGSELVVRLAESDPGELAWSVSAGEVAFQDRDALDRSLALWSQRGHPVQPALLGSLFGLAGRVLDNRRYLLLIGDPASEQAARDKAAKLRQTFGLQATLHPSSLRRPHGVIEVRDAAGTVLALAQDLVTAVSPSGAPIRVRQVEFGVGFRWHGREDRTYRGSLAFVADREGGLAVVNELPLEDYVRGIVPSEIFPKAHPEALKAQAVAARGEVLSKIGTRHLTDPYLLCAEQHCQVYSGMSGESPQTDAAVEATRGELLFAKGGGPLVESVYSANCGGHGESNEHVWGTLPNPALRGAPDLMTPSESALRLDDESRLASFLRSRPRAWCSVSSFARPEKHRWERRFTLAEVDELARPFGVGPVRVLAVARRGVSGRATVLTISGEKGATQIRGELAIRQLFGNLNSAMFVIEPPGPAHPSEWVFRGAGWGHGVGMCQLGAIGRAEHGQTYRQILRHYYGGAEVQKVY